ncbi:DEAD/DEAH box helicase [Clostridium sp. YIM B02515]|uniref:DEAD/DEAH box helicase n=1 Tax=Clostridium rhizosphaerae TaxID=2803861 RepID=A0ABS1TAJ1_9CLOT|nr:DEAD/DEAH box helicase [Clostridium rhizosphaerae]MBL4936369.1 DEAD/DEAH box helicase [Clostridium rhizosphaerae]
MYEIDEQKLKNTVGNVIYARGLDIYLRNKIRRMDLSIEDMGSEDVLDIDALVDSSYGTQNYNINVKIGQRSGRLAFNCDCDYSASSEKLCKHVVAVLLKFNRERDTLVRKQRGLSSRKTNEFINCIKNNMLSSEESYLRELSLEVKYNVEFDDERKSTIELKVGENKTYVVKNMRDFLSAVDNKDAVIEFGKNFTYDPAVYTFKEEDKNLIDLLLEVYQTDKMIATNSSFHGYWNRPASLISGKKAVLTDRQVKRFFIIMKGKCFDASIDNLILNNISILEENMPLEFDIKLTNAALIIKQNEDLPLPLTDSGEYFFYKNNIYHPLKEQTRIYLPFYTEISNSRTKSMSFNKADVEKVASYIIPNIKNISKKINIDKSLENKLYEEELKIRVYLDKEEDGVSADIIFKYGNIEINPLNEKDKYEEKKVLIRDITKELQLISYLISAGFREDKFNYKLKDEERLVEFLTEGLNYIQEQGEVYYSDRFKNMKVYTSSNIKSNIRLNDEDLLEFSFNIEGIDKNELKDILGALKQKKKYYKLKKGGFVSLQNKELQDMGSMIEYLDIKDSDLEKDRILLSKYNALYIDQNLKGNNMIYVEKNKRFRELVNNIREVSEIDFNMPEHLEGIMRGYQKFGFKWFKTLSSCGFGGILADEMGLGKTLQTIAFIESEVNENSERKPSLVVAPTSLVYNWKSEIEKFASNLKSIVISGSKDEREEKRREIEEADIVITSYPLIRRDIEEYKKIKFRYCILDEAQQIKNPASINAQSVKELKAQGYFALTGTPIENSLTELWSIFDFIMPGYLLSHNKFLRKYETPIVKSKDEKALEELNKHVRPFILRRLKKDVVKELPPKIEHKLVVEMTEEQKKLYAAFIEKAKQEVNNEISERGFNRSKIKILSILTRLRQICCDPSTFVENFEGESGKMLALDDLLVDSINEGHRILLFSQFTSVLKNIAKRLNSNNIDYMYLDGQTKTEDRVKMVEEFNKGQSSIFLISLKAGGTGLNLTGADVVIHFDPWWNPAVEEQATDRAHRIGQQKTVEVIKIVAQGTIEEKIYNLQEKKREIIKSVMGEESSEESLVSQMTQEEIEDLFKF